MKTILIQLDTDPQPSSFDRVVAVDAGIDEIMSYGSVTPETVEPLVHGAMFTRGPDELKHTALFVGGSDVTACESVWKQIINTFFGPVRVSVMMDSNGCNTTAAAAVLTADRHLDLNGCEAVVLGGTGPVGRRAAQLLALHGARVRVGSRSLDRAAVTCREIAGLVASAVITPAATGSEDELREACRGAAVVIAAGAAGVRVLSAEIRRSIDTLKLAIDLNAVPPEGLEWVQAADKAIEREGILCYGAIGVGGTKMKIHKAALKRLFDRNDQRLDTEAIYHIGQDIVTSQ